MKGGEDILENDQKDKDGDNDVTTHDGPTGFWAPYLKPQHSPSGLSHVGLLEPEQSPAGSKSHS